MKKNFNTKYLREELDLPWSALEDKIIDTLRWSAIHEIIFELDGKYWRTEYSCGLTELQDEGPWDYEDEVECEEVEKKIIQVESWVPVKEE